MLLFLWARPTLRFSRPAHAHPRLSLLTPSPANSWGPRVSRIGASLPKQRRAARVRRGRDAVGTPPTGRSQAPRAPHRVTSPLPDPPSLRCPTPPLNRATGRRPNFSPRTPFVSPVHARAPHRLPHRPPVRLAGFSTTGAPPPCRTPSARHRCPPPSGERPSELLFPSIDRRLLTPGSLSSCRTQPPSSMTTGVTPLPLNAAAPATSRRPTVVRPPR
jgi:hypothetical protein